ncbi:hypothetical protein SAMN05660489_00145 [Pseudomonas sp. LAMO17WK12:I10]|nr:hypothetical protein H160_00376 [Pseudomonas sp. LAMO17WK12:I9]SNY04231.1 hypothetical protein SAMN05660489_00145 [Pseudomonas sp. LAMO17WK12:I10]
MRPTSDSPVSSNILLIPAFAFRGAGRYSLDHTLGR